MTQQPHHAVPTLDEFGARIALIRWQMRWNQKEAALATGLPPGSWREWEVTGRAPRNLVEVSRKISAATGIDDYWIMTGREGGPGPSGRTIVTGEYLPTELPTLWAWHPLRSVA